MRALSACVFGDGAQLKSLGLGLIGLFARDGELFDEGLDPPLDATLEGRKPAGRRGGC